VFPSMLVFPSMPKGEIVGQLVVIDVNPWSVLRYPRVVIEIDGELVFIDVNKSG
jgi:hypothetical protein